MTNIIKETFENHNPTKYEKYPTYTGVNKSLFLEELQQAIGKAIEEACCGVCEFRVKKRLGIEK